MSERRESPEDRGFSLPNGLPNWIDDHLGRTFDAAFAWDSSGRWVRVNASLVALSGHSQDELLGKPIADHFHVRDADAIRGILRHMTEAGLTCAHYQGEWLAADGTLRTVLLRLRKLIEPGEPPVYLGTVQELSQPIPKQSVLRSDLKFIETVMDTVTTVVVVLDREGRILRFNREAERATGYRFAEIANETFFFLVPDDERDAVRDSFFQRVKLGGASRRLNRWLHRDGTSVWLEWSSVAMLDDAGDVEYVIGTGQDVTEIRRVHEELSSSRQRYELAIAAQNDGIWDLDFAKNSIYYSDRWFTMLGYAPGELKASFTLGVDLVIDEDREMLQRSVDLAVSNREPFECEVRMRTRDGGYRWILTRGQGVFDEAGQVVRMVGSHSDIQRRKSAEESLRESQFRLEEATEVAGLGTWHVFAVDGFWWSPKMYEFHGVDTWTAPPDWEGYLRMVHEEDRPTLTAAFERLFEDGVAFSGRYRIVRPNGEVRILVGSAKLLPIDDSYGQTCVGTCLDITDQAVAELELRKTRDLLLQSQRIAKMGSLEIDLTTRTVEWSEHSHRLLGSWSVGRPFHWDRLVAAAAPEQRSRLETLFARAVAEGIDIEAELCIPSDQGGLSYFQLLAKPIVGEGGEVRRFVGSIQDVTESHEAARQIATQRTFLRRVIDASPGLIFVKDRDGRFVMVNQAVATVYGCQVNDLIGKRDADFSDNPDEVEQFEAADRLVLQAQTEPIAFEEVITDHRGQSRWLYTVKQPIISPETGEAQVLGVCTDITERVRFQHQLEAAREAALESSRLKSEFIANLSHEIRTPMNGLLGMTDLLSDTTLSGEQSELVRTIKTCGESLLTLLNDLLDFSKVEAGKMTVELTKVDVVDVLEEVVSLFSATAFDKGLALRIDVDWSRPYFIRTDPGRLRQVLSNLLANAVKFTEQGGVTLSIREAPEGGLRIHVSDTGIGIPSDRLNAIFESFVQGDGSTTRRFGGTGLGLTISRQLTELLGGTLRVTSEVGVGSTFSIEFPPGSLLVAGLKRPLEGRSVSVAAEARDLQGMLESLGLAVDDLDPEVGIGGAPRNGRPWIAVSQRGDMRPSGASTTLFRPVTRRAVMETFRHIFGVPEDAAGVPNAVAPILVVDDNVVSRRVIVEFLRQWGISTVEAPSAVQAIQKIQELPFSMILMDVELPEMSGIEATRQIRCQEADIGWSIPIVGLSGRDQECDRDLGMAAGMNDYLVKPIHREELQQVLTQWLPENVVDTNQIDLTYLREIAGDDEEFQRDVIAAYTEALPGLLAELQDASAQGDLDRARRAAHTLKGSSRSIGANPFAAVCEAAEEAAKSGDPRAAVDEVIRQSHLLLKQCQILVIKST